MPSSPFDSALYGGLFGDADLAQLFTERAELRAMLIVEGTLAEVQGALGMIPADAASAIKRAAFEVELDPAALAAATGRNGVAVPALVGAFRTAMGNPEAAAFAHWGATSQDIHDTGLALRLRQVVTQFEARLSDLLDRLADLASTNRTTPMAARTWGMAATPTSLGAVVASWGQPILRHVDRLDALKPRLLTVSLSGAAGTLSAMEPDGTEVRARLAAGLGLSDPGASLHTTRDHIAEFGQWCAALCGSLAKMSEDILSLTRSGEATLSGSGGSSTMPQKQNPVLPSAILALSRHASGLGSTLTACLPARDQRDGGTWMAEWLALPQIIFATGRALSLAHETAAAFDPNLKALRDGIDPDGLGLIYAEALQFRLARSMPRPDAQAAVKDLVLEARGLTAPLERMAARRFPDHDFGDLFQPEANLGDAPYEADRFCDAVSAHQGPTE